MNDVNCSRRALELVQRVLADHLDDATCEVVLADLASRADDLDHLLYEGVNPPRTDYGRAWEQARADAYVQTEDVGAVHLELGTWTAFPQEVAEDYVERDRLAEFIRLDADARYDCDVVADATVLPFGSGTIDRVSSNSTVEHIADPHLVIREALRVLRPGGVFTTAMPFVWHEHGYPHDYVRLTRGYWERALTQAGFVDVQVDQDGSSGLYYTLHNAAKMAELDPEDPHHAAMGAVHRQVVALLGSLIPLDRHFTHGARYWYHSVRVLARKPGQYQPSRRTRRSNVPFAERAIDLLADPETKQGVHFKPGRVICEPTGRTYMVSRSGAVNFLEPQLHRDGLPGRARKAARLLVERVG